MADGKVIINVVLADEEVNKSIHDIDKRLQGLEGSGSKGALGIGKIVAALGLVQLAGKAINLVKDSISSAFSRIDTMESFERVMSTITGSTEETAKALDRTREIVTGTAYGLDVAAMGVQNFVTRGVSVDKATERIEAWGDAVAFYGEGSNEQLATVNDALAKMTTSGKVGMDQLNRLFDIGIDAVGMYAKATGRNAVDVQKDLSSGKISAEDFIDTVTKAMMEGTNGVHKVAGAAKEAGASWGASFDNMKAAVTRGVVNIIQSLDEMLANNGLPSMREMVADFGRKFEEALNKAAELIPVVIANIKQVYDVLKPWLPLIGAVAAAVAGMILAWATFNSVKSTIENVKKSFKLLNAVMAANPWILIIGAIIAAAILVYVYWEPISEFFIKLWDAIKVSALAIWDVLKDAWSATVEWFKDIWGSISGFFKNLWDDTVNVFKDLWNGLVGFMKEWGLVILGAMLGPFTLAAALIYKYWDPIKEFFMNLWDTISNYFVGVWSKVTAKFTEVKEFIQGIWGNIVSVTTTIWEAVYGFISGKVNNILDTFSPMIDFLKNTFTTIYNTAMEIWGNVFNFLQNTWENIKIIASSAWEIIKNLILGPILLLINLVTGDMEEFRNNLSAIWTNISEAAGRIWNALKEIVIEYVMLLVDNVSTLFSAFVEIVTGYWTAIWETIVNIWNNLIAFLLQTWENIKSGFTQALEAIKTATEVSLSFIQDTFNKAMNFILEAVAKAWKFIDDLWKKALAFILGSTGEAFDKISHHIQIIMDTIWMTIETVWYLVKQTFTNVLSFIKALVTGDFGKMKQIVKDQMALIKETIRYLWDDIKVIFSNALQAIWLFIKEKFTQSKDTAIRLITDLWNGLKNIWDNIKSFISTALTNIWNDLKSKFTGMSGSAKTEMNNAYNNIKTAWDNAVKFLKGIDLKQIGKDIIQGLIDGIKNKVTAVGNAVKEVTSAITGKLKSILKIASPSKITFQLGEWTGEGVEGGLLESAKGVAKAAGKLAEKAIPDVSGFVKRFRGRTAPVEDVIPITAVTGSDPNDEPQKGSGGFSEGGNTETIVVPVIINGREVMRATVDPMTREQKRRANRNKRKPHPTLGGGFA